MPRMTSQQLRDFEVRMYGKLQQHVPIRSDSVIDESELHNDIISYCKSKGWIYLHGSMAHRTRRVLGEPDFILLAPGKVWFIECKTDKGKLSTEQLGFAMHAQKLGHEVKLVRSMDEFRKVVEQ